METDAPAESVPHAALCQELLKIVEARRDGKLTSSELLAAAGQLLSGFALYPREPLLQISVAVGDLLDRSPSAAVDVVLELMSSETRAVRGLAAGIISRLARFQPAIWANVARQLTTDDDWDVRDLAAHVFDVHEGFAGAAEYHLAFVNEVIEGWVHDANYLVRRAATQALIGYALAHEVFVPRFLALTEPLADDPVEYVRRSLAQALGRLGRRYPVLILNHVEARLASLTPNGGETFSLVLNHPFAEKLPDESQRLLSQLATLNSLPHA